LEDSNQREIELNEELTEANKNIQFLLRKSSDAEKKLQIAKAGNEFVCGMEGSMNVVSFSLN